MLEFYLFSMFLETDFNILLEQRHHPNIDDRQYDKDTLSAAKRKIKVQTVAALACSVGRQDDNYMKKVSRPMCLLEPNGETVRSDGS